MAVERANPLPVGRYWVDVPTSSKESFEEWLQARQGGSVIVRSIEPGAEVDWFLFDVLEPVQWDGPGYPTIASGQVYSKNDTVDRPEQEPDIIDQVADKVAAHAGEVGSALGKAVVYGVGLVGFGYAVKSVFFSKK
jgi:hypothetical protein